MHVRIAKPRWLGKRSRHSRHMRNPQCCVSGKRPIEEHKPRKLAFMKCHCVENIVFEHTINFCVDTVRMVYFPSVWLCFICVSIGSILGSCVFTLSLRCHRAHGELKMVSNQHIVNTKRKNSEHTLASICCELIVFYMAQSLRNHVYSPCHQRWPALRNH